RPGSVIDLAPLSDTCHLRWRQTAVLSRHKPPESHTRLAASRVERRRAVATRSLAGNPAVRRTGPGSASTESGIETKRCFSIVAEAGKRLPTLTGLAGIAGNKRPMGTRQPSAYLRAGVSLLPKSFWARKTSTIN